MKPQCPSCKQDSGPNVSTSQGNLTDMTTESEVSSYFQQEMELLLF